MPHGPSLLNDKYVYRVFLTSRKLHLKTTFWLFQTILCKIVNKCVFVLCSSAKKSELKACRVCLRSWGLAGVGCCALLFNLPPILHSSRPPWPRGTRDSPLESPATTTAYELLDHQGGARLQVYLQHQCEYMAASEIAYFPTIYWAKIGMWQKK